MLYPWRQKRRAPIAPRTKKPAPRLKAATEPQHKLHDYIMKALGRDKIEDVLSINLKGKSVIADYMVIGTGRSSRQVTAAAKNLRDHLAKEGFKARVEGHASGDWVIVDAGDVVVHLFRPEVREFYNLEKLWATDFSTVGYNRYTSE